MSFFGYFHLGHPAFEFSTPSLKTTAAMLHGDGWNIAGDSIQTAGTAVCAFHGGLSNCRDLCETLGLPPETSAPAVILHLYSQKEADFQSLRGAFSFVVLDTARRKLLLVRDQQRRGFFPDLRSSEDQDQRK